MSTALLGVALVTCVVLGWSGIAKLRDPASLADAMRELRVPAPLAGPAVRRVVPWAEILLGIAVLLAPAPWSAVPWALALVLFLVYLALIWRAAVEPEQVSCNCFGASSTPVTAWTVARNALLVAVAAAGLVGAVASPQRTLDLPTLTATAVVLLLTATGFALGRDSAPAVAEPIPAQPTTPQPRANGADDADPDEYVREPIPPSVVEREPGQPQLLRDLASERAVVMVYLSATCAACEVVMERLPGWMEQLPALEFVVLSHNHERIPSLPEELQTLAVADVARSTETALGMNFVPSAAILGADGHLAGGPVTGIAEITGMIDDVIAQFTGAEA